MQTDNYRIVEASAYKDNSKPLFFPEVMITYETTQRSRFKKVKVTKERWERFIGRGFEHTNDNIKTIKPDDIDFFKNTDDIVAFSTLALAQSWLRRYAEYEEKKTGEVRKKYLKYLASQDEKPIIHELDKL